MPDEDHDIPTLTTDQMREVDRLMVDEYGIALLQMMEHAGRHLAHLARRTVLDGDPRDRMVVVLAGTGGNGGGGLVAARRLRAWGAAVRVITTKPPAAYEGVPAHQLSILQAMDVPVLAAQDDTTLPDADVLIDALIGYSLSGAPRGPAAALIRAANDHAAPVLSLDVPSGLEATTGTVHDPTVHAAATLTLALPKTGLHVKAARPAVGQLYLADISVPPQLYAAPSLDLDIPPLFATADLLHLTPTSDDRFRARPL
jgi:NAD(P)H-hydrate epimerase